MMRNLAPSTKPLALLRAVGGHRHLLGQLVRREVVGRYRGSVMGLAWSFLHPLLMLAIYTFVFSVVFRSRWSGGPSGGDGHGDFAVMMFAGLIVHGLLTECLGRAPGLVLANPSYVKRVVFPLEILPLVNGGSALFHAGVSALILVAANLALGGKLTPYVLLAPVVILPMLLLALGASWLLAALGVYFRDLGQVIGLVMSLLLFVSPVLYPLDAVPETLRTWVRLNPLTLPIQQFRGVMLLGEAPDWSALGLYGLFGLLCAQFGFWVFQRLRHGFADVL